MDEDGVQYLQAFGLKRGGDSRVSIMEE